VEPVEHALEHVKRLLFRPFNLQKWFIIGFCAWLAHWGEGGVGGSFNIPRSGRSSGGGGNLGAEFEHAKNYVLSNLSWIVPLLVVLVLLSIAIGLVVLWLKSRGQFMFLHCVALDRAEIVEPWRQYSREGNSLFLFRVCLSLASSVLVLPLLALIAILVAKMVGAGMANATGVLLVIVLALVLVTIALVVGIVAKLTADFVVPIMYLRHSSCLDAWKEFWPLLSGHAGRFVLYLLFLIVLGIAISTMVLVVILITCCLAGCLMAIPYLGAVVLLPITMFRQSYSLFFLAQFGPEYDVFPAPAASGAPLPRI
jgi:hypothetical protein